MSSRESHKNGTRVGPKRRKSYGTSFESPKLLQTIKKPSRLSTWIPGAPRPTRKSFDIPQTAILHEEITNSPPKRLTIISPLHSTPFSDNCVRYAAAPRLSLISNPDPEAQIEPDIVRSVSVDNQPRGSIATLEAPKCRICLLEQGEDTKDEPLISPCRCKGTVGILHASCLQHWLVTANSTKCELCGYRYILKKSRMSRRRDTIFQQASAFRMWITSRISQRHIIWDSVWTLILLLATVGTIYLCVTGAIYFHKLSGNPFAWQIFGLGGLIVMLTACFFMWTCMAVKHHWNSYKEVQRQRREMIQLQEKNDDILHCTILPRPRGSSIFLRSQPPSRDPEEILGTNRGHQVLEPVEEVTELLSQTRLSWEPESPGCEGKCPDQHNFCSPSHHTKNNISLRSTDVIL